MASKKSLPSMPRVLAFSATCTLTTSLASGEASAAVVLNPTPSSVSRFNTPFATPRNHVHRRKHAREESSHARSGTSPISPSVRPNNPRALENSPLFHCPARRAATLSGMRRSGRKENQSESQFGHGDRIFAGAIGNVNPAPGSGGDVDGIESGAGADHEFQIARGKESVYSCNSGRADHQNFGFERSHGVDQRPEVTGAGLKRNCAPGSFQSIESGLLKFVSNKYAHGFQYSCFKLHLSNALAGTNRRSIPHVLAGKPVIRGTRLAVEFILDLLAAGQSESEIVSNYPGLIAWRRYPRVPFITVAWRHETSTP